MNSDRKMDVVDWQDSPLPVVPQARGRGRSLPPTVTGILGTLLLHAVLIQSVSLASRGQKPKVQDAQGSANALLQSADADNLVLISLPTVANASQAASVSAISSLPDLSKMKIHAAKSLDPPAFLNLETLALSEDQASNATANAGDGAELSRLFGIYTGQIQARVDRVWRRPRTPVNESAAGQKATADDSFQCEAQIIQDAKGNVQEILLPRCNGSPAWRRSLVLAIGQASPLPAPPSVKVFAQSITLSFLGLPYFAGSSPDDDYEFAPRQMAPATNTAALATESD